MTIEYRRRLVEDRPDSPLAARAGLLADAGPLPPTQRPDTLYAMGEAMLHRVQACALELGLTLPERQVIYMSPIPADCEQVAVLFNGWSADQNWETTIHCNAFRWIAGFSVVVTRCTPAMPSKKGATPTPDQMMAAAKLASDDAELMLCVLSTVDEIGTGLGVVTQAPQGGYQSVELDVSIAAFGSLE